MICLVYGFFVLPCVLVPVACLGGLLAIAPSLYEEEQGMKLFSLFLSFFSFESVMSLLDHVQFHLNVKESISLVFYLISCL